MSLKGSFCPPQREFKVSAPSSPEFPFFEHKNNPSPLWNFHEYYACPPYPLEKTVLARKCVKVKSKHSKHLTICIAHYQSIVTSEDTHNEKAAIYLNMF